MKKIKRRHFLAASAGAAGAAVASASARAASANDRIVVGIMGVGGRGTYLTERLAKRQDVRVAYLCDVDSTRFERAAQVVESSSGGAPKRVKDFRKILDDGQVDALLVATPNQWHALATIMACQAGKDVYVEKPASNCIWEGRKMVEAARKHGRIVQTGMQCRSAPYFHKALEYIRQGHLGDVYYVRVLNMTPDRFHPKPPAEDPPATLDWDFWCGPSRRLAYSPGRWWMNVWDYSAGKIMDDAVHQMDLARALVGLTHPLTVTHSGGVLAFQDGREIPDSQFVTYEFEKGLTLHFQATLWAHYMKKTPPAIRDSDQFPDWQFNATRVEIFGTGGMMVFGRHGGGWQAYDPDGALAAQEYGRQSTDEHLEDFIQSMRTRKKPRGDIGEGHLSALLCHAANVSYRAGNRKLHFDAKRESFAGDPQADAYLKPVYRRPWVIPDEV